MNEFDRLILQIGEDKFKLLQKKKVLVIGVGGVGSYLVESLVRSGILHISIVDHDIVDITNINRQLIALHSTIGKNKVDVVEERIKDINPNCTVKKYKLFLNEESWNKVFIEDYDYIIDCSDSINTKKLLIDYATKNDILFISSMGTANKMDPFLFMVTDIRKTKNDPVARILRKYVKDKRINKKVTVLSSIEVPKKNEKGLATNSFTPSVAGLLIASHVIKTLINYEK